MRVVGGTRLCVQPFRRGAPREDDRIPGLPESSIASSLPRELADPGGIRSALGREGITFHVNYIGEVLANPTGGVKQGTVYDGRLEFALKADMEKTIGWRGLSFFTNGYQIHGRSISANNLGVLMPVSFIDALPDTRLFELWLEQKLFDGKLSIRLGQLSANSDFIISQGAQAFLNGSWGWPSIAGINLPDGGPSYPMAAPGVRVLFAPNDHFRFRAGLYTGDPADDCAAGIPQKCIPTVSGFRSAILCCWSRAPTGTTRALTSSRERSSSAAGACSARPSSRASATTRFRSTCRPFRGRSPIRTTGSMPSSIR